MTTWFLSVCLQRIILPAALIAGITLRQNGFSLVYLFFLLIAPIVPVPSSKTMAGSVGHFQRAVIVLTSLNLFASIAFQLVLAFAFPPYGHLVEPKCSLLERIFRHVGLIRMDNLPIKSYVVYIAPEIIVLTVCIVVYRICCKLHPVSLLTGDLLPLSEPQRPSDTSHDTAASQRRTAIITILGKYVCLLIMCFAGILRPSILSGVYYVSFLGLATAWACNRQLGRQFAWFLRLLMVVLIAHITALFLYQLQWVQEQLPPKSQIPRYLGLTALLVTSCEDDPRICKMNSLEWASFVNPFMLIILYFALCFESDAILNAPVVLLKETGITRQLSTRLSQKGKLLRNQTNRWRSATRKVRDSKVNSAPLQHEALSESTPETGIPLVMLIRGRESVYRRTPPRRGLIQDSRGSVTVTEMSEEESKAESPEDRALLNEAKGERIPLQELKTNNSFSGHHPRRKGTGVLEVIINAGLTIAQLLAQSSYIGTNIIMMAWSITYHSWLTFVLLLWASVMWLVPNQRRAMLRTSPFLVLYAVFLLLAQYIYGMDLTEEELPQTVQDLNLKQIGFEKVTKLPCKPLLIKTCFTVMFWITLKQYIIEKQDEMSSTTIANIAAPLQLGVGTATGIGDESQTKTSQLVQKIGGYCRSLLTKFWIWIVASILFTIGITGERMTIFRIIYMALALIFILTFQISWSLWRKIMYGFWLTVIIYSMLILVMTYTYQFDNFDSYWERYLHIDKDLQKDIGLERFDTANLFVKLLTPTFFVIITVIQLYYFHKDFLAISDIKSRGTSSTRRARASFSDTTSGIQSRQVDDSDSDTLKSTSEHVPLCGKRRRSIHLRETLKRLSWTTIASFVWKKCLYMFELFWLFLELHMLKLVMLTIMMVAIYDVCALHILFVTMTVVSLMFGTNLQIVIAHAMSLFASLVLLAKMIYQIDYINHGNFSVACEGENKTYNTAEWIGFRKTDSENPLHYLLRGYIAIILIVTFHAVVLTRQKYQRHLKGRSLSRPLVMFPGITFVHADRNIRCCLKYLANYVFYRFGIEICLISITILIATRMDIYACVYAIWVIILITPRRSILSVIWPILTLFIGITIPFQYFLVVGLPPFLCVSYPWAGNTEMLQSLREWLYLPDEVEPPSSLKLACDFIVYLMVCRQGVVFRIEKKHIEGSYAGGSNKSIIHEADQDNFHNPTMDFISYTRSYLDVLKRIVLQMFLWVTLAIVFLAGSNRVNLFSLGYLIGAFIFLWQGNDLYLRPVSAILKWWHCLISYNVTVIFIKTILQMAGCLFLDELTTHTCWAVQLFGIACIKKFGIPTSPRGAFDTETCEVYHGDVGLAWDGVCFAFLILQRRLFNSYYFFHIIDEAKAMSILASRGAELIEELSQKRIEEQQEAERKILEKIKNKMDRIKASQKKLQGPTYKEPDSHFVGSSGGRDSAPLAEDGSESLSSPQGFHTPVEEDSPPRFLQPPTPTSAILSRSLDGYLEPQRMSFGSPSEFQPSFEDSYPVFSPPPYGAVVRSRPPWFSLSTPRQSIASNASPKSHHTYEVDGKKRKFLHRKKNIKAIRSGDYYMFEDFEEDGMEDFSSGLSSSEDSEEAIDKQRPQLTELLSNVLKGDMTSAADKALEQDEKAMENVRRRASMPVGGPRQQWPRKRAISLPESPQRYERIREAYGSLLGPRQFQEFEPPGDMKLTKITEATEPQPGTSQDDEDGEKDRSEATTSGSLKRNIRFDEDDGDGGKSGEGLPGEEAQPSARMKAINFLKFLIAFVISIMVTITIWLNKFSRDYRFVMKTLSIEKKQLKGNKNFGCGVRRGSAQMWEPLPVAIAAKSKSSIEKVEEEPKEEKVQTGGEIGESPMSIQDFEGSDEMDTKSQPAFIRLLMAVWYAVFSHSELLCYFIIFLHQVRSPTILSLPLPLMVFLWGTLTVPRPSKTFWVTIIAYTEVVVVIKCICQFELIPWNSKLIPDNAPFALPRIIGVERQPGMYAYYDLLLLLVVFFHRSMLKSLGLWKVSTYSTGPKSSPASEMTDLEMSMKSEDGSYQYSKEIKSEPDGIHSPSELSVAKDALLTDEDHDKKEDELPIRLKSKKLFWPFLKFFHILLRRTGKVTDDVYAYMFFCDFFNFLVVIFGFAAFGSSQGDGGVSQYFEENKVPIPFLVMLILQFGLIIVDRTLYLRKFILGKIIFQFILVIGIHIWMFFVLPAVTQRSFNAAMPPQMWYMVKCIYLLLSAYQIRVGYPTRILGNFLCKSYNYINMFLFKVFMLVPFVFELRALMDWIWTDTSMTLSDWLKMEDIFAHVFQLKCQRRAENEYPQPRGEKKANIIKYFMGGGCLVGIIAVIWFPLVLFALGNTVGEPNLPYEVSISVQISSFIPIYKYTVQNDSIFSISANDWEKFGEAYKKSRTAQTFLSNYEYEDVGVIHLKNHSSSMWTMSPPAVNTLKDQLVSNEALHIRFAWKMHRITNNPEEPPVAEDGVDAWLMPGDPARVNLYKVLDNQSFVPPEPITFRNIMPKFIKVTSRGTATPINQMMIYDDEAVTKDKLRSITITPIHMQEMAWWWDISEDCRDSTYDNLLKFLPENTCSDGLIIYTFNDKAFPASLNIISGKGIIGLYTTFVIVIHSVIRGFFTGISFKIMFDDMPNVDRLLQLCLDIYLVRESGDLDLEEDLFAKLVFLYRSPETLIKWTRPPEEAGDDEQDQQPELND